MSVASAMCLHLRGSTGISDIVSTFLSAVSVFRDRAPQTADLPYIVLHKIGATLREHSLSGAVGVARTTFQANCWAADGDTVESLATAVVNRCNGDGRKTIGSGDDTLVVRHMQVEGPRDSIVQELGGGDSPVVGQEVDIKVVHNEATPDFD